MKEMSFDWKELGGQGHSGRAHILWGMLNQNRKSKVCSKVSKHHLETSIQEGCHLVLCLYKMEPSPSELDLQSKWNTTCSVCLKAPQCPPVVAHGSIGIDTAASLAADATLVNTGWENQKRSSYLSSQGRESDELVSRTVSSLKGLRDSLK